VRRAVRTAGLISASELVDCIATVERHLDDPDTIVISHLYIQAWGRKPDP
jgi:hypothetical protein